MEVKICPVCGSQAVSAACPACGWILPEWFAGEQGHALWKRRAAQARTPLLRCLQDICVERHTFTLGSQMAACILPESRTLVVAGGSGVSTPETGVYQYSVSERNEARLYADGTVKVTGDSEYRQSGVPQMREIRYIAAAANCVYGVTKAGTICASGTAAPPPRLSGVRALACGHYHIAALLESGKAALDPPADVGRKEGVKLVAAEGRDTMLLYQDGRVSVFPSDAPAARQWIDVASIAMDSVYAVGLSRDGSVLLAQRGKASVLLDIGRSGAAEWRNMIAVSCCRSGIGAVDQNGCLHLVGNIPDKDRIQQHWNNEVAKPLREELMRLASAQLKLGR